jgi:hypothetical protein
MTGRFFEPRPTTVALDGSGGRIVLLGTRSSRSAT